MVLEDIFQPEKSAQKTAENSQPGSPFSAASFSHRMARPLDRLAAVVADVVLLLPVYSLLLGPLRKHLLIAELSQQKGELALTWAGLAILLMTTWVLYQTVFLSLKGATPGKLFVGIRVFEVWNGRPPRPSAAFLRSLTWCLELLALGMPYLSVFSNERRRPFHDRIGDTVVVTSRRRAVPAPDFREHAIASGFYASALVFLMFLAGVSGFELYKGVRDGSFASRQLEENQVLCRIVGETQKDWWSVSASAPSRLQVALALFNAEAVGEDCLESEADFSLWRGEEKPLAYLAKGLAHAKNSELFPAYLEKVCEADLRSEGCRLSRLIQHEKSRNLAEVSRNLKSLNESSAVFLRFWAVRHFLNTGEFEEALRLIEQVSPHRHLGVFVSSYRAKVLWGLRRKEESRTALKSALDNLEAGQRLDLAQWFCHAEATEGCGVERQSTCAVIKTEADRDPEILHEPAMAATLIRDFECENPDAKAYKEMAGRMPVKDARLLLQALADWRSGEKQMAVEILKGIAGDAQATGPLAIEARTRLTVFATQLADLDEFEKSWTEQLAYGESWRHLGRHLLDKYLSLGSYERSMKVAEKLLAADPYNEPLRKSLVVSAFRAGETDRARAALKALQEAQASKGSGIGRRPAGEAEFESIAMEIEKGTSK